MGRPERPLNPDGGPVEAFAGQLRVLRDRAGRPSYASMARRVHRSQTTLSEAAGGDRLPTWDTTEAYVRACSGDPDEWLPRWQAAAVGTGRASDPDAAGPADAAMATEPGASAEPAAATEPAGPAEPAPTQPAAPAEPAGSAGIATVPEAASVDGGDGADGADGAAAPERGRRTSRWRPSPLLVGGVALALSVLTAAATGVALARSPGAAPAAASASSATAAPDALPMGPVADGADPKDSGCALDPGVVTLDSAEVDLRGLPAGLVQLRYSPQCGVGWSRFEAFPKAVIPTGAAIHVDVVRPASHDLRLPFAAPWTGVPVYGNVMVSTSHCVFAAAAIEVGGAALPESRTHCFRGRIAELTPVGTAGATAG